MTRQIVSSAILLAAAVVRAANSSECSSSTSGSIFESVAMPMRLRGGAAGADNEKSPMILLLGDSNAEFSGTSLQTYCKGCVVVNKGIGGSMTVDWTPAKFVEVAETLPEGFMPTHIWLTIGGNDFMERHHCQSELMPQLLDEITKVGSDLRSVVPPEVQILMTGYMQVTGEVCDFPGFPPKGPAAIHEVNGIIEAAAASVGATYLSIMEALDDGGTPETFTPESANTHQDIIHLSNKGYCKLWTHHAAQSFFGCASDGELTDCESVPVMPVDGVGAAFMGRAGESHRLGGGGQCASS